MSEESIKQIKQQLQLLYPQLFDDPSAKSKLDPLMSQAGMVLKSLLKRYKKYVSASQYQQLMQLMTAHLLYQSEDNNITSGHIADVSYTASNSSKTGNGSGNATDPYIQRLLELLGALGIDQDWRIQFD